jgi:hypothetical protein
MVKDQYYHLVAQFAEDTGGAIAKMYWSYSGQARTLIPSSQWFYPGYVGSSPYNVTISCPTGYTGTDAANPNK